MITVVCWKWQRSTTGHQLPNVGDYTLRHVHTLQSMIARNTNVPHRFVCCTDDPRGLDCETVPLWPEWAELGGCYRRLRMFAPDFTLFGKRWLSIDLDTVITGNIDHLLEMDAPFAIHRYAYSGHPQQHYNGGLILMNQGARPQVWERFDPEKTPLEIAELNRARKLIGSDQAHISRVLGDGEVSIGPRDGVMEFMALPDVRKQRRRFRGNRAPGYVEPPMPPPTLPGNARMIMFSGPRDPVQCALPWVQEHYR